MLNRVYLSLGSNIGRRRENIAKAVEKVQEFSAVPIISSSLYETEPWGFEAENKFINCVLLIETQIDHETLLKRIGEIERQLGRNREDEIGDRYSSRIIDIDILFYNDQIIKNEELIVPHPKMHLRKFVLEPLNEIAPNFVHPLLKKRVSQLFSSLLESLNS